MLLSDKIQIIVFHRTGLFYDLISRDTLRGKRKSNVSGSFKLLENIDSPVLVSPDL